MPLQKKPHATSHLLVWLMVLNMGGVALLFIKADLDVQQIRNEIGIVRSAGEIANVAQVEISDHGRSRAETRVSVTIEPEKEVPVTLSVPAVLRVVVDDQDEYLALLSIESGKATLITRQGRASSVIEITPGAKRNTRLLTLTGGEVDPTNGIVNIIISRKSE